MPVLRKLELIRGMVNLRMLTCFFKEQEVIVGHLASPCNAIWKSVTALNNMNLLLVDMTAAGVASVNLETAAIR